MNRTGVSEYPPAAAWPSSARACHDLTLMYAELMWTAQLEAWSELVHVGLDGLRRANRAGTAPEFGHTAVGTDACLAVVGSVSRMVRIQRLYREQLDKVLAP